MFHSVLYDIKCIPCNYFFKSIFILKYLLINDITNSFFSHKSIFFINEFDNTSYINPEVLPSIILIKFKTTPIQKNLIDLKKEHW